MQEQPHYKITPEQGWSQLLPALDKAMPVERRLKFFPFWWAAAATVIVAIGLLFLLDQQVSFSSQDTTGTTPDQEVKQEVPGSPDNNSINNKFSEEKTADIENENVTDDTTVEDIQASIANKEKVNRSSSEKNNLATNKTHTNKTYTNKSSDPSAPNPAENNVANAPEESNSEQNIAAINTVEELPETLQSDKQEYDQIRNSQSIAFLPLAELSLSDDEELFITGIEPGNTSKFSKRKALITPHVLATGMMGTQNSLGAAVAIGVDLNITPRFSITTDFGYQHYQPDAFSLGFGKNELALNAEADALLRNDLEFLGVGTYIPAEEVNKEAGYNSLSPFVHSIRYWQFSVGCNYDLSRRFYVGAGVNLGFGAEAKSSYPIVTNAFGYPTVDELDVNNSFSAFEIVRSQMTLAHAEIGYRLGKKLDVFAGFTHGFDQYLLNEQTSTSSDSKRTDYIRGLNVGMKYTL